MKILNFGSLNIDYVYSVDHFVKPGETILSRDLKTFCGGKGLNQSIAAARAGGEIYHAGCIGHDGQILLDKLTEQGVDTRYINMVHGSSGHAIIQVDQAGQNCIILYGGANQLVSKTDIDRTLACFNQGDILLLQNEINQIPYIMAEASKKGMVIALNPSPINGDLKKYPLYLVKYFILNEIEGKELTDQTNPEHIVKGLLDKYPDSRIVLTLGKQGVLYLGKDLSARHCAYDVEVVDTTAAGDTFTGYLIECIRENLPVEKALEKASIAASISVSRMGASDSIPSRIEVEQSQLAAQ
jgi:ribokinase